MAKAHSKSVDRSHQGEQEWRPPERFQTVRLQTVAELLDASRSSARRWLKEAGIRPIAVGRGAKGAIRYRWPDVRKWLESLQCVE